MNTQKNWLAIILHVVKYERLEPSNTEWHVYLRTYSIHHMYRDIDVPTLVGGGGWY